jgi:hypothetical protein
MGVQANVAATRDLQRVIAEQPENVELKKLLRKAMLEI